jgi:hypothetical protein
VDTAGFGLGIELFNRREFFEAHEVLEDVWRAAPSEEKKFLQGLIQVAVALHHHSRGNPIGAGSLLKRAAKNLDGYPVEYGGIRLDLLRASVVAWQQALESGESLPAPPRLLINASQ